MDAELARIPSADDCVLGPLLERRAREQGDKVFARLADGREWTYAEALADTRRIAAALQGLGVKHGDRVLCWLPNGIEQLQIWFGLNYLGAVFVPINLAYKGRILEHVIQNSDAALIVAHRDLAPRLAGIELHRLARAVVLGGEAELPPALKALSAKALDGDPATVEPADVAPWDTQMIIYTSGTTGPSKGVLTSYIQTHAMTVEALWFIDGDDRELIALPLFHVGGASLTYGMLARGGSVAIVDAFDTRAFWRVVRENRATVCTLLGVMTPFLLKEPESPADRDHTLRKVLMVPLSEDASAFASRFGSDVYTGFNMTEVSTPLVSERNPKVKGTCGRPRPGVDVRLVDENDCEVAPGIVGELIVRTARPWAMNHGYNKNPEATSRAWRNGWFHTGDAFRRDEEGNFFFVDRMKDAIRRRGENISSFEVEAELCAHPAIREAAAVAVANEYSEDEVLAVVSLADGQTLDPAELIAFLIPRMAHFMVPRYIRVMEALPRTPTQKVEKYLLRSAGITSDTWDREQAGIRIKREKIGAIG
ncbi:AMP-binding protein [Chelatococcus reniformis]|uniref:ATP-dependent acyl-CoA ligase n=1 Tax=Chelatococcus reniformis TaxID=1494448 RepID=A0A916UTV2_9HYPH|nr:AMP-binding protein [Chelatococcus reniformis]GGC87358.1 ATP-dependent acyl-CoA ligase [Chelatococcus reniformis]